MRLAVPNGPGNDRLRYYDNVVLGNEEKTHRWAHVLVAEDLGEFDKGYEPWDLWAAGKFEKSIELMREIRDHQLEYWEQRLAALAKSPNAPVLERLQVVRREWFANPKSHHNYMAAYFENVNGLMGERIRFIDRNRLPPSMTPDQTFILIDDEVLSVTHFPSDVPMTRDFYTRGTGDGNIIDDARVMVDFLADPNNPIDLDVITSLHKTGELPGLALS